MASLIPGYEYDIFISYRQKDNKHDGWVTEFVNNLKGELESTFKEEISVYFDINPHDGLLETHDVDDSLKDKLKCLVFIPIISRTYCDQKSFAWEHEFKAFVEKASKDQFGLKIRLPNGNVANRVLPIRIHDLENTDIKLCESVLGGVVRGIEFIYKSAGVNRPLTPSDYPEKNQYKTFYRDQINKVANAIKENISGLKGEPLEYESEPKEIIATIKNSSIKEKSIKVTAGLKKKVLLVSWVLFAAAVIVVALILTNVIEGGKASRAEGIKSLVVLPFENYTGDEHLDYVADGMHASLIGDMGKLGALRVIGKTSSSVFKNTGKSAPDIARELHVDALVEPTLTSYGDSVCIQIRVITPFPNEKQLWVADYREDKRKIVSLYSRIAKQIADELMIELTPEEERLLAKSGIVDRDAYDEYLKGLYYLEDVDKESLMKAVGYLNRAVEKDSSWAPLYTGLTLVWASIAQMGFESPQIAGPKIFENLNKALELDPDNSDSRFISGEMAFLAEWDWEKSEKELLKALAINPSNAIARVIYAQLLSSLQRPGEALMQANIAIDLDPKNPMLQIQYAAALLCLGDCENALIQAEKVTADDPGHYLANNLIESAAFRCGKYDKVIEAAKFIMPARGISYEKVEKIYSEKGFIAAYEEVLRQSEKLAQNNFFIPIEMAIRYMWVNQPNKALEWIEKGFEIHDPNMPYISTRMYCFDPLFSNPRFIDIITKMNLPLPKTN
jgi:TolB-like protein